MHKHTYTHINTHTHTHTHARTHTHTHTTTNGKVCYRKFLKILLIFKYVKDSFGAIFKNRRLILVKFYITLN